MEYEWDPAKASSNFYKHGILFDDAIEVFNDPKHLVEESTRPEFREERKRAIGYVGDAIATVVFTTRGDRRRIISARRARTDERRRYRQSKEAEKR